MFIQFNFLIILSKYKIIIIIETVYYIIEIKIENNSSIKIY